jgi:4-alpha-glucanotransferase
MADISHNDSTTTASGLLRELAAAHGVGTMFRGWDGVERSVPDSTLQSVLAALGVPAAEPDELQRSLRETKLAPWRRLLPPAVVARQGQVTLVNVHVPHGQEVRVWIEGEDGSRHEPARRDTGDQPVDVDGVLTARVTFAIAEDLPLGWHTLVADAPSWSPRSSSRPQRRSRTTGTGG